MAIALGLIAGLVVLIGVLVWHLKASNAVFYWFTGNGFRAIRIGNAMNRYHLVDSAQLRTAIIAVLDRSRLDTLFLGPNQDEMFLSMGWRSEGFYLDIQFLTQLDTELTARVKEGMQKAGYSLSNENSWNVGMGPDLESTTLTYDVPNALDGAYQALDMAFHLRFENGKERWLGGWRDADFRSKDWGPSIQYETDPLLPVLGLDKV